VRDYRSLGTEGPITAQQQGDITMVPNWLIGRLRPRGRTLFVNIASLGEMSRNVVAVYLSHAKRFADAIYLRNKYKESDNPKEETKNLKGHPECYALAVPKTSAKAGTVVLDGLEYKQILDDRFIMKGPPNLKPIALINWGYQDLYPTSFCEVERSHVPYFEAVWERRCAK